MGITGLSGTIGLDNSSSHRSICHPGKLSGWQSPKWTCVFTTRAAAWPDLRSIWSIPFIVKVAIEGIFPLSLPDAVGAALVVTAASWF